MTTPFTQIGLSRLLGTTGTRQAVKDTTVKGLRAELREGGSISFQVVARIPGGRVVRYQIGKFPSVSVNDARQQARKILGELATGTDVAEVRREERGEMTFGECFTQVWLAHAKAHKKSWAEDERQYKTYLSHWKNRKLSEITRSDIKALHLRLGEGNGKYTANRVLSLLHAMFAKGIKEEVFSGGNPAHGIQKHREQSRERFLQADELPRFLAAVQAEPNPTLRDFFLTLLFTGARKSNVQQMRWENIDWAQSTWKIPRTKNGESLLVPLPPAALSLLQLRHMARGKSVYVFPGNGPSGHIVQPSHAWERVCKVAGLENVRIHDLRRTLGSWQAATGASLPVIGKSLGHKTSAATQVYARVSIDPVRAAVNTAVDAMLNTAKKAEVPHE